MVLKSAALCISLSHIGWTHKTLGLSGVLLHRGNKGDCLYAPWSMPSCPWNAQVAIYNFLIAIGCPSKEKMPWCPCPFKNEAVQAWALSLCESSQDRSISDTELVRDFFIIWTPFFREKRFWIEKTQDYQTSLVLSLLVGHGNHWSWAGGPLCKSRAPKWLTAKKEPPAESLKK